MMKNIIEYLEQSARDYGDKTAIIDGDRQITFSQLECSSMAIASGLCGYVEPKHPLLIWMDKSIECIEAFLAAARAGCFYVPVDIKLPYTRVRHIVDKLGATVVLTRHGDRIPQELSDACSILYIEALRESDPCAAELARRRSMTLDIDPLYAVFTSGSTGIPKGILTTHRALISFIDEIGEKFHFSDKDVLASQIPFYFDACTKDIYLTMKYGCTMCLIPQKLFMLPLQLVEFLNKNRVTRIIWVPSLLSMLANFKVFEKKKPLYLESVFFVGEAMPAKQYNIWKRNLPDVQYVNLYGSTEVTGSSMYYIIDRELDDSDIIPIGRPFDNMDVLLLDAENTLIDEPNVPGEICIRGASLSLGYFREPEKTREVFVQNPLQTNYFDLIYRTGDIGRYNERHELVYVCRKDYQIKRMGRRIELGEIDAALTGVEGIDRACCLFDDESQTLIAVYEGSIDPLTIKKQIRDILPAYMLPNVFEHMESLPLNPNGKIDRVKLKTMFVPVKGKAE